MLACVCSDDPLNNETCIWDVIKCWHVFVQMILLQKALDIHGEKAHESLQPFHAHLVQRFRQMKDSVEKDHGIKVTQSAYYNQYHKSSVFNWNFSYDVI